MNKKQKEFLEELRIRWYFLSLKDVLTMPNTEQIIVTDSTELTKKEGGLNDISGLHELGE